MYPGANWFEVIDFLKREPKILNQFCYFRLEIYNSMIEVVDGESTQLACLVLRTLSPLSTFDRSSV
jgi:hypothetical protein